MEKNMQLLITVYNELINGASIQKLVNIVREYIGNPIAVCNCNLENIAFSKEDNIEDTVWNSVTSMDEQTHLDFEKIGNDIGLVHKVNSSRSPVIIENEMFEHRYMNCAIFKNNKVLGNIVFIEYYRVFNEEDQALLEEFSKILAFHLANKMGVKCVQDPNAELIMLQMLRGDHVSLMSVFKYLFKPKESEEFVVVVIDTPNNRIAHRDLLLELKMLLLEYPDEKAVIYNDKLVFIFRLDTLQVIKNIKIERLKKILDNMGLVCGVSKNFSNIMDFRFYYDQANNAIIFGERYSKENSFHFYQDISLLHLLDYASQSSGDIMQFCSPELISIIEYDEIYNTKYFLTLYIYFHVNSDMSKAAEVLCINRNSMHYRMNKIREIVGPAFKNHRFGFHTMISISILYYLQGEAFYEMYGIPENYRIQL